MCERAYEVVLRTFPRRRNYNLYLHLRYIAYLLVESAVMITRILTFFCLYILMLNDFESLVAFVNLKRIYYKYNNNIVYN